MSKRAPSNMSIFLYYIFLKFSGVISFDTNLSEWDVNRVDYDVTPVYQSIIISDIADILQELDKGTVNNDSGFHLKKLTNNNPPFGDFFHSSGSDENVEDLLSEYQHYLDKAQKQTQAYIEKTKAKNNNNYKKKQFKPTQYFTNSNAIIDVKPFTYTYEVPNSIVDVFMPMNYSPKVDLSSLDPPNLTINQETIRSLKSLESIDNDLRNFGHPRHTNQDSPKCGCNQCSGMFLNSHVNNKKYKTYNNINHHFKSFPLLSGGLYDNSKLVKTIIDSLSNNVINVRMKIDIKLPANAEKYSEIHPDYKTYTLEDNAINPTVVNLPFPYLNFPTSFDGWELANGNKIKNNKINPVHKMIMHKRKRNRQNNTSKRHHKKVFAFQDFKINDQKLPLFHDKNSTEVDHNDDNEIHSDFTIVNDNNNDTTKSVISNSTKTNVLPQELSLAVNVTFNSVNYTTENSQALLSDNGIVNSDPDTTVEETTFHALKTRSKRQILINDTLYNSTTAEESVIKSYELSKKDIISDEELTYWPDLKHDSTVLSINLSDINTFKSLLLTTNISETLFSNDSETLKNFIIKMVDWDNINRVASLFTNYFGKYFQGILTFCSTEMCSSIKCYDKKCFRRTCLPECRQNHKGHCNKFNSTDSVIMDSNIDLSSAALDMVNILQDKLLGKIFGKGTLCINAKCVTFVANKKTFFKAKCITKNLNAAGHCVMTKPNYNA